MIMLLSIGTGFQPAIHGTEKKPRRLKARANQTILIPLEYPLPVER